jgi:hypothetical protein
MGPVISGAQTDRQVAALAGAGECELGPGDLAEIDLLLEPRPRPGSSEARREQRRPGRG